MMDKETDFIQAIRAAPDDPLLKSAYSDWLQEHGMDERAELVRVIEKLNNPDTPEAERKILSQREQCLVSHISPDWLPGWLKPDPNRCAFAPTFGNDLRVKRCMTYGDALSLNLIGTETNVRELVIHRCIDENAGRSIQRQGWLGNIERLMLTYSGPDDGVKYLRSGLFEGATLSGAKLKHVDFVTFFEKSGTFRNRGLAAPPNEMFHSRLCENVETLNYFCAWQNAESHHTLLEDLTPADSARVSELIFDEYRYLLQFYLGDLQDGNAPNNPVRMLNLRSVNGVEVPPDIIALQNNIKQQTRGQTPQATLVTTPAVTSVSEAAPASPPR